MVKKQKDTKQVQEKSYREAMEVLAHARSCMGDDKFVKYASRAMREKDRLIKDLTEYVNDDPLKYAFVTQRTLVRLGALNALLYEVEQDRKGSLKKINRYEQERREAKDE